LFPSCKEGKIVTPDQSKRFVGRREKVCVFIDNCDLFTALHRAGSERVDYKRLRDWLVGQRHCPVARYYCGEIKDDARLRNDFYEVLRRAAYEVVVVSNFRSDQKHAALDPVVRGTTYAKISWDMCDLMHMGRYDTFILVSGSEEYVPVVSALSRNGIDVEVSFLESECSPVLRELSHFRPLKLESVTMAKGRDTGFSQRERSRDEVPV
jgi:uncharacterized LabA/DUF88 family protein